MNKELTSAVGKLLLCFVLGVYLFWLEKQLYCGRSKDTLPSSIIIGSFSHSDLLRIRRANNNLLLKCCNHCLEKQTNKAGVFSPLCICKFPTTHSATKWASSFILNPSQGDICALSPSNVFHLLMAPCPEQYGIYNAGFCIYP